MKKQIEYGYEAMEKVPEEHLRNAACIIEQFSDSLELAFEKGKQEANEEWKDKDPETINPEYRIKYALECLKDAKNMGDIDQKIRELEFELCRFL